MKTTTKKMCFSLNCMYVELNGGLAYNARMRDARSKVTVLSERWIKEPIGMLEMVLVGIVQMECLALCKWSVWDCANEVVEIVQIVVTMMGMCCAVKFEYIAMLLWKKMMK